jgi:hypothetical protein
MFSNIFSIGLLAALLSTGMVLTGNQADAAKAQDGCCACCAAGCSCCETGTCTCSDCCCQCECGGAAGCCVQTVKQKPAPKAKACCAPASSCCPDGACCK